MRHATFRQLQVFEAVARLLSFSRAAEELHLTQPAVSTQVGKLEDHVGLPLFEQFGKKIHLTPAGSELLGIVRSIIAQLEAAEHAMTQFKGIAGGRLNVGVVSAGDYFFPRLLVEFIGRHQGVVLNFTVHNREELLSHIAANLTDLAIMGRPPTEPELLSEAFAPHPYVIVAAPNHRLVGRPNLRVEDLLDEPFVMREKGSDTRQAMKEAFGDERFGRLRVALEVKSTETIKQAVRAGMGLGFLSTHTIELELRGDSLRLLDVIGLPLVLNWFVVHRRQKRLPPVAQAFKDFLLQEGASLIDDAMMRDLPPAPRP